MKKYLLIIMVASFIFGCQQPSNKKPVAREVKPYSIEQFMDNKNVFADLPNEPETTNGTEA